VALIAAWSVFFQLSLVWTTFPLLSTKVTHGSARVPEMEKGGCARVGPRPPYHYLSTVVASVGNKAGNQDIITGANKTSS